MLEADDKKNRKRQKKYSDDLPVRVVVLIVSSLFTR